MSRPQLPCGVYPRSRGDHAPAEPLPTTPHFLHLFAGALTLADWIGSARAAFDFEPGAEADPEGYWHTAQERAARACARIGLTPATTVVSLQGVSLLERVFPRIFGAERPRGAPPAIPTPCSATFRTWSSRCRAAAFSRHLLVVDELHSYDRYMAEVLQRVLDVHSAAGGVSLLISATLSDRERLRFGGLLQWEDEQTPFAEAIARSYPVVSVCDRPGEPWTDVELEPSSGEPKPPLGWRLCAVEGGLVEAVRAARAGARVCGCACCETP